MKKLLAYLCFLSTFFLGAQVNLVIDPSFEIHDSCNYKLWIEGCRYWHSLDSINNVITNPTLCTPTYANVCASDPYASLPDNYVTGLLSHKYPRTGNGLYITLPYLDPAINSGQNRWYLRGKLTQKLIPAKQYCGKYYVSLYKTMIYAVDRLGAYLDDGSLDQNNVCVPIVVTPAFENPAFNYITDTVGWTKIEGAFTANGTEQFITIGNFYSHANTHKIVFNATGTRQDTYYYTDDVSIIPIDIKAYAGEDVTLCLGDSISLGRTQEVGLECLWYTPQNALPFSYNSNFTFKATETGKFSFIQKMDNCQISFDTVNITVVDDCMPLQIPNTFSPNEDGVNDSWRIDLKYATDVSYAIYNRWGNLIKRSEVSTHRVVEWDGRTTAGESVTQGVYYFVLEYTNRKGERKKYNGYITLFR
jgi:gliding motility-associated-like protein